MISVVVPTWNGRALLESCLRSLARQTRPADEVIVVDNGSTDGTVEWIDRAYPRTIVVALDRNYGFAVAVNRGIDRAKGELIALLNNDAEAEPTWLEELERAAQQHPEVASFASKMLFADRRGLVQSCGIGLDPGTLEPFNLGSREPDGAAWSRPRAVLGPSAGAAMFRRSFFEKVGLFDEDFVSYYEDVDLALRACLLGLRCLLVPSATVSHIWAATSSRLGVGIHLCKYRNHSLVWLKNLPGSLVGRYWFGLFRCEIRWALRYFRSRYMFVPLWAWADLVVGLPRWLRKRHEIQMGRCAADQELIELFSAPS